MTARLVALFASLALGLGVLLALVWTGVLSVPGEAPEKLQGPDLAALQQRFTERTIGIWDSHVDPDVGRVMLPNKLADHKGVMVRSNVHGMRERPYRVEKPAGLTRVVFLGDSYVFGHGSEQVERMGVFLQRFLLERGTVSGPVEVLHLGASSWNLIAESAYLRRQLDLLRPALVVQLAVPNDLGDSLGARGFGGIARYTTQHRERAGGIVTHDAPRHQAGFDTANLIIYGLDWESRSRYAASAAAVGELARQVERCGGRYLLMVKGPRWLPIVAERLVGELRPEQVVYLPDAFALDLANLVSERNNHFGAVGHERIAKLVYGLCVRDGLLSELELTPWDEADAEIAAIAEPGERDARNTRRIDGLLSSRERLSELDFANMDKLVARHIYGGVDGSGFLCPYASFLMRNPGGGTLHVEGTYLDRLELEGSRVEVFVEELVVGALNIRPGEEFEHEFRLPPELAERAHVAVRFVSEDFVYSGDVQHPCIVLQLGAVSLD